jgi:maltose alpha-D-glucosyltransferase/alpha-amylase
VFYAVDLDVFRDGDGDGTGDFWGLTASLDYLAWLGVDALWLLPCYPSPNLDNGYDITDHYDVAPRLGAHSAFMSFMHEAERRGIRVVLDLVVHHTSMQHPWFMDARNGPRSKYYDYYVWTQDPTREPK